MKIDIKSFLRSILGDAITGWIHALRFCWLATHETQEIDINILPVFVNKGDIVVDVGANGANWTLPLSRLVGESGRVYAFEADPYYADVTKKTITLLGLRNVAFFPHGLSDKSEESLLQILDTQNKRVSGTGLIVRRAEVEFENSDKYIKVTLEPLDKIAYIYSDLEKVKLIKCDVEGFELIVFRGASQIINKARPIVITEVGGAHLHGYCDEDLFNFFKELNYNCYVTVTAESLRTSDCAGEITEGLRPNRIMIPQEYPLDFLKIQVS